MLASPVLADFQAGSGDEVLSASWTVIITVGIAVSIGYVMFRVLSPMGRAETPTQMGQKWFAWVALATTILYLPKFLRTFHMDPFETWILNLMGIGGLAFVSGWLYGKLSGRRE